MLALLTEMGKAMSEDEIEKRITIKVNRTTIYRILNQFCEDGTVHRIVAADGKQYFAVCPGYQDEALAHNHAHFRCIKCQTVECLPTSVDLTVPNGYQVSDANCVISGICRKCL